MEDNQPTGQQLTPGEIYNQLAEKLTGSVFGFVPPIVVQAMHQYAAQQTAALREELEIATQEIARLQCLHLSPLIEQGDKAIKEIKKRSKILAELEAVKKERDALAIRARSTTNALIHIAGAPFVGVDAIKNFAKHFLSDIVNDISSGETKPGSSWVSVEEIKVRIPGMAEYFMCHDYRNMWGLWQQLLIVCNIIPAPPESLTDKK